LIAREVEVGFVRFRSNAALFAFALLVMVTGSAILHLPLTQAETPPDIPSASQPFPETPVSMGQPNQVPIRMGPLLGYSFGRDVGTSRLFVDFIRRNPLGLLQVFDGMIEGSIGTSGNSLDGSVGAYLGIPWFFAGVDYDFREDNFPFRMSLQFGLRRGGLFGSGDMVRIDYQPSGKELLVGLTLTSPFEKYRMTRPREKSIALPPGRVVRVKDESPPPPLELESSLANIAHSIGWMDRLLTPSFKAGAEFDSSAQGYRDHIRVPGHTYTGEDSTYHAELEKAMTFAVDGDLESGLLLAALAESLLFEEVVVPFNRTFGRVKRPPHAGGLAAQALVSFQAAMTELPCFARLADSVSATGRATASMVFQRVLEAIEDASIAGRSRWRESFLFWERRAELAWLPLNYGLRPAQYDSQREWDAVLAKLTEQPFEDLNTIKYLMYEQFHLQLKIMLRETEFYQVTMIHDFRGTDSSGDTDIYGWDMVADGYIMAFQEAIEELDAGTRERLPQFFLFLDEHYFQANKSRDLVSFLENLYGAEVPGLKNKAIRRQVQASHDRLMRAIESSSSLSGLDEIQLGNLFKVNVSITNPFDPTFAMDVTMRDHRKLGFRDVFEDDPTAGAAIFTGQGVGEHYNGSAWEDRGIEVRGESLVQLKNETRRMFLSQGFGVDEVPRYLRAIPYPDDHDELRSAASDDLGWATPVSIATNETGYGYKKASILKAAMYNLAPEASVLLCFDSLWISDFWAGMFISASVRGAQMFPVAPTPRNAPSNGTAALYYLRQNLQMMLQAQLYFAQEMENSDGMLRVGIYTHEVPIDDIPRRAEALIEGREAVPFLTELFPFHPIIVGGLHQEAADTAEISIVELQLRERPLLHLKNQFFGTREAFAIVPIINWAPVLARHLEIRKDQLAGRPNPGLTPELLDTIMPGAPDSTRLIAAFERVLESGSPGALDRVIYTFTIGSHNQNPRSLALDGEVLVAVSGYGSLIMAIDCMFIMGIASWPTTMEGFDSLFPEIYPSWISKLPYGLLKDQL
jgi:hypothetical protein